MGKKEASVIKKGLALFILTIFVISIGGCETIKGAFDGAKRDWESAKKIDDWMQKNLW